LTNPTQALSGYALTHSIAALRRLCVGKIVWLKISLSDVVNFMAKFHDLQNIERHQEIASGICHLALWDDAQVHIIESDVFDHILGLT
jgi:hypothetical protein